MEKKYHIETLAVQAGWQPKNGEPRVAPIAQSTTFKYDTAEELAKLFDLEIAGHFYTRLSNPTAEVLEKKMAALEGGVLLDVGAEFLGGGCADDLDLAARQHRL